MAQSPITSFFKRGASSQKESAPKKRQIDTERTSGSPTKKPCTNTGTNTSARAKSSTTSGTTSRTGTGTPGKGLLSSYTNGNEPDPHFFDNPTNKSRHEQFLSQLVSTYTQTDASKGRRSMKPYDLQFIELKSANQDSILMIQNGYKYQILGEDAYKAARVLGRSPIPGWRTLQYDGDLTDSLYDRFASLTFPIERLPYYVEKIVTQGFKVAVAKQQETSALKAQGDNKKGPFRREVSEVYTKGTMVEELTSSSTVSGHIMAIQQFKSSFAMLAVQTATGDVVYDVFEDSSVAMELETRLMHIQPSEILVVGELTGVARKMIESLGVRVVPASDSVDISNTDACGSGTANGDTDIADNEDTRDTADDTENTMQTDGTDGTDVAGVGIPVELHTCWRSLQAYLDQFNLSKALTFEIKPFSLKSYMYLSGTTLSSLEIFENQTTNQEQGSLFWAMDVTHTAFGRRLLKQWIGKPLLDREMLATRVEAVEELMNTSDPLFSQFKKLLVRMPDLERYTLQVFHNRIQPKQLYWYLYFFDLLVNSVSEAQINAAKIKSPLLHSLMTSLLPCKPKLKALLSQINIPVARNLKDDISEFFYSGEEYQETSLDVGPVLEVIDDLKFKIAVCREEFTKFLKSESKRLKIELKEARVWGEEDTFVIGVARKDSSKVPKDWRRQGAITSEVRFWAPFSLTQTKILKPLLEKLAQASQQAYTQFVKSISETHFEVLRKSINSIATLDCLFSLADVSSRANYVKPDIVDEKCLEIENGRHPMLEQTMLSSYIPNDVKMYDNKNRTMIITGANMGGKSSFVRQVALIVIMAQIGCFVPATSARLSIADAVYTRMGAFDNLLRGESTFMVELKECSAIMANATPRSLVLLDEIGRGTSTMDGVAIADAVLKYMVENSKSFMLFITHYPSLCEVSKLYPKVVSNWSMDCAENDDEVVFLFKVVNKPASKSYGINVARLADLPETILRVAEAKADELETEINERRAKGEELITLMQVLNSELNTNELKRFIQQGNDNKVEEIDETQAS